MNKLTAKMRAIPEHLLENQEKAVISTYDSMRGAGHAVNVLAEADFPVETLAILGADLQSFEKVTGKLSYGRVALSGAFNGIYLAVGICLITVLLGIVTPAGLANAFGASLVIGVGLGMLIAVLTYTLGPNRRSFMSVGMIKANRYDLVGPQHKVAQARQILAAHAAEKH